MVQLYPDMKSSVVIVSNRLPFSVKKNAEGKLEYFPSVGGLATGLASYANDKRNKWIGWPGIPSDHLSEREKAAITKELRQHNCYPVFLKQRQLDAYYNGYSNSILWPLFHDLPVNFDHHDRYWRAYRAVNRAFAEEVLALTEPDSTIWIHDYQLLTLPALLRRARPKAKIGFFLHIPFPAADKLSGLPSVKPLLDGMLGADLMGFHTPSYVANFLEVCNQYTRELVQDHTVILRDRVVRVTDFPISIDYEKFAAAREQESVQKEVAALRKKYGDRKVILTVDRLDPTKGLAERLQAYYDFLKQNERFRGRVVMVMLAVPSRTEIDEYRQLKERVEGLVAAIRTDFGTKEWDPIDYQFTSLPFESVSALYQVADIAFIAPLRDGMNLVAKEFIASKKQRNGVLILSETAGAAEELTDALMVNPSKPATLVRALTRAVTMPSDELTKRLTKMQRHVATHTVQKWAGSFMQNLQQPIAKTPHITRALETGREQDMLDVYRRARHPLLLFDYDGVLSPHVTDASKAKPSASVRNLLERIATNGRAHVAILSGRSKVDLAAWLGDLPLTLVGEHGAVSRPAGRKRWQHDFKPHAAWQDEALPILEKYAELTPGAYVESKEYSLVWHYRAASTYYAQKHLVVLRRLLRPLARRHSLELQNGSKILEIRPSGIDKGTAARKLITPETDFILAIGDDITDEDTFEALPVTAYTIKVGSGRTAARYRLASIESVTALLKRLAK